MLLKAIRNRRSVRSYKKDAVPQEKIIELIKAAQFAPNSHHNRSHEFILIKNPEAKERLSDFLRQSSLKEVPLLIVPLIDLEKSTSPVEDLAVASENIFIQAAASGLGTVWKNLGQEDVQKKVKEILGVPKNFLLINIIPVGYPRTKRRPHNEKDFEIRKIHYEKW